MHAITWALSAVLITLSAGCGESSPFPPTQPSPLNQGDVISASDVPGTSDSVTSSDLDPSTGDPGPNTDQDIGPDTTNAGDVANDGDAPSDPDNDAGATDDGEVDVSSDAAEPSDTGQDSDSGPVETDSSDADVSASGPIPVTIGMTANGGWQLYRGGQPYRVQGVGGFVELEQLVAVGGNSIRTWGVDEHTGALLDEAHALGLTVTLGIWLGHKEHGFDYEDSDAVAAQLEKAKEAVLAHRDHPALLMWGVGNEVEIQDQGLALWSAINDVAEMIHAHDPNHPTVIVTANVGENYEELITEYCPAIDVWGINRYGGLASLDEVLDERGWTKPYMVTEFGPRGGWEVATAPWGAVIEQPSAVKAAHYLAGYEGAIAGDKRCLGSYAFVWMKPDDPSDTWFAMLAHDGGQTPAVDAMSYAWTGSWPSDLAPEVTGISSAAYATEVDAGANLTATLDATDPEGGALTYTWLIRSEADDGLSWIPTTSCDLFASDSNTMETVAPSIAGAYRLHGFARDSQGKMGYASMPFRVAGSDGGLPLWVDQIYAPSGWMGDATQGGLDMNYCEHPDGECSAATCYEFVYSAKSNGWAGVFWQYPANNWGEMPGFDMPAGATAVQFRAWGAQGGETVSFNAGIAEDGFELQLSDVVLSAEPTLFTIPLGDASYETVRMAFGWVTGADPSGTMTFSITDIQWIAD